MVGQITDLYTRTGHRGFHYASTTTVRPLKWPWADKLLQQLLEAVASLPRLPARGSSGTHGLEIVAAKGALDLLSSELERGHTREVALGDFGGRLRAKKKTNGNHR